MRLPEYILQIEFQDRLGLGYEVFNAFNNCAINLQSMEARQQLGMIVKFQCQDAKQVQGLTEQLKQISGVLAINTQTAMPSESLGHEMRPILGLASDNVMDKEITPKARLQEKRISFDTIIYQNLRMRQLVDTARLVAKGNSTILLRGESGTGKELFARAIHVASQRADAAFVVVNCTALPDALLESELFGYVEGAFTGASRGGKKGLIEQASGGTLFLDEIGEISPHVQVRLLRVLQENTIRRIGATTESPVDVRIIAATHRNLEEMIKEGKFREDLYYRLNIIPLFIPPLRERREDIPVLAQYLVRKICRKLNRPEVNLSKTSLALLMAQYWQGNVRQLENTLERIINVTIVAEIEPEHFYEWANFDAPRPTELTSQQELSIRIPLGEEWPALKEIVGEVEKQVIMRVLEKHSSSRKAGKILGVSNTTILNKMNAYGIK